MNNMPTYDPDAVEQIYNPGNVTPITPVASPKPSFNAEVATIDENSTMDLSDTSEELPEGPPLPAGVYDTAVDTVKLGYSSKGNLTLSFSFKVTSGQFIDRLIFWNITPGTEFGKIRLKQLLSRSLTTDIKGQSVTLLERVGSKGNYSDFVASGVSVGARTRLTVKQKPGVDKNGVAKIFVNVTDVALPKTGSFM